jgi:hypothetical protein
LYHVTETEAAIFGHCTGDAIPATFVGNYVSQAQEVVPSVAIVQTGPTLGFTATAGETWSAMSLAWEQNPDAVRWQVISRASATGVWYARNITSGGGAVSSGTTNTSYSSMTPKTSTGYTWTAGQVIPTVGQQHEYRIRMTTEFMSGPASNIVLSRPAN